VYDNFVARCQTSKNLTATIQGGDADLDRMEQDMRRYNPEMQVFRTNMKTGDGIRELLDAILA